MSKLPTSGSLWRHSSCRLYRVILIANKETDRPGEFPVTIVYQRLEDGTIWSRPFSRWYPSFTEVLP